MACKEYFFPKSEVKLGEISHLWLHINSAGDVKINKSEIVEVDYTLCDTFILAYVDPIISEGIIKLKIKHTKGKKKDMLNIPPWQSDLYFQDRRAFLERELTQTKAIDVTIFDINNQSLKLFSTPDIIIEDEYLILKYTNPNKTNCSSDKISHIYEEFINEGKRKSSCCGIGIQFETGEDIYIQKKEILDIHLECYEGLKYNGTYFHRTIKSGYILVQFENANYNRDGIWTNPTKELTVKDIVQRLCGKKGESSHDIVRLEVESCVACDGNLEPMELLDIRADENGEMVPNDNGKTDDNFISGFAKHMGGNTVLIAFGKNAKEILDNYTYEQDNK